MKVKGVYVLFVFSSKGEREDDGSDSAEGHDGCAKLA